MSVTPKENRDWFRDHPDWEKAEQLFNIRYKYAVSHAYGMERLAFTVLPYSLLRSFALTFDPREKFLLGDDRITPVNRTVTRTRKSALDLRRLFWSRTTEYHGTTVDLRYCTWYPPDDTQTATSGNSGLSTMPPHVTTRKDTTRRTRRMGSDMGGFEKLSFSLAIPDRSAHYVYSAKSFVYNAACPGMVSTQDTQRRGHVQTEGGHAIFSTSDMASLRSEAITRTTNQLTAKLPGMIASLLPSSRTYSISRNAIELRDMPRTIAKLASTLYTLRGAAASMPSGVFDAIVRARLPQQVPDQWLAFWFAWRQTYKDIEGLLTAPERILKRVNFLISRRGRPTVLRSKKKFLGDGTTTPGFTFNPTAMGTSDFNDVIGGVGTRHTREHEIRLVLSVIFDFPEVGVPKLRGDLFRRKIGLSLTPTDIYNLIPWTWLVDWFTGLGNYVEMIDVINTDRSLVNWGLATCVTKGRVVTEGTSTHNDFITSTISGSVGVNKTTTSFPLVKRTWVAELSYVANVRKNITEVVGVKALLEPTTLSTYQQSIVGAILARRSGFTKT